MNKGGPNSPATAKPEPQWIHALVLSLGECRPPLWGEKGAVSQVWDILSAGQDWRWRPGQAIGPSLGPFGHGLAPGLGTSVATQRPWIQPTR